MDKAKRTSLSAKVELVQAVPAPVAKGQKLGTIKVYSDEKLLIQLPLVAGADVEKLGFWDVYKIVLQRVALGKARELA